ncbi:hypothetical protein B7463_g5987, partial [Scytalidium lignicola]
MPLQPLPRILGADEIIPTLTRHTDAHRKLIDNITETINVSTACFENVIRPLVELENVQAGEKAVIDALKYCSPSLECQHTVDKGQAMLQEYSSNKRRDLYILVKAVKDRGENLDYESQKLLDRILLEYEEYGYGSLDDDGIQRRRERMNRIEELCTQFHRNLREYNGGEWFTPEELDGVPAKDLEPAGPDGKALYSHNSKYYTIMRNSHNPETRRRWQLACNQRFAENVPIFREVILLRDENAREIGLTNHAATKLPYRTAESTKWVDNLMNKLTEALLPHGKAGFERVKDMKQRCLQSDSTSRDGDATKFMPWDFVYYSALLSKEFQVDHAAIAEYFPLRHTVSAMLDIFADCLQLRFEPIPKEELRESIWHEDIEGWVVWDERLESKGDFIGFLFADLLGRPNKYKGNQSVNLQPVRAPLLSLSWNYSAPTTGCLLQHNNVITLFHELGHSIHDLVARTNYARFHGYQVALELAEGIGMMLENWCWLPDELKAISRHYTKVDPTYMEAWLKDNPGRDVPSERIPDELLRVRLARRGYAKVDELLSILLHSFFDMAVHNPTSREALLELDEVELFKDIYEKLIFRRPLDPSYLHVNYGHLLAGYDAGYYSYVCAEIFAANLFQTTFAENPRSRVAWERFRHGILEYGGSRNELEIVEEFLGGRPPDPSVLLAMLGMSASTT